MRLAWSRAYLLIEEFRLFLAKHDIPTSSLGEVMRYMDNLTARDNPSKLGWQWCPVRPRDAPMELHFGTPSVARVGRLEGTARDQFRQALLQQMANEQMPDQQSALSDYPRSRVRRRPVRPRITTAIGVQRHTHGRSRCTR